MKILRKKGAPRLRNVTWAVDGSGNPIYMDRPKFDPEDYRRMKLELKKLEQPPKMDYRRIIVPD